MHYIYCYTNKKNNHKYIGQTNNLNRRKREHLSAANNPNNKDYNDLFHSKLREYGIDGFDLDVLEILYTEDINEVNQREQYWIEKYQSFCGTGLGYNKDHGGCNKDRSHLLSDEELNKLREDLINGISYEELRNKYNISNAFISTVNQGIRYRKDNLSYPLHKYFNEDKDYDDLIDLLLNSDLSLQEIADTLHLGYSTVKKINAGTLRKNLYPNYPIRKKTPQQKRSQQIKKLLLTSNLSYTEIAKISHVSTETVRRVNKGEVFKENNLSYPLRSL